MGYLCAIDNVFTPINLSEIERSKCRKMNLFIQ